MTCSDGNRRSLSGGGEDTYPTPLGREMLLNAVDHPTFEGGVRVKEWFPQAQSAANGAAIRLVARQPKLGDKRRLAVSECLRILCRATGRQSGRGVFQAGRP